MEGQPLAVVDTNVLLHLALPVVDGRQHAPTGGDPLRAVCSVYDVHVPDVVVGEISEVSTGSDLLAAAAETVLRAGTRFTTHRDDAGERPDYGLDAGETHAIRLANDLEADLFVTDEFNSTNYLLVSLALDDRNTLFTTPHVLCTLASADVLSTEYVEALLTYYVETKDWDRVYVERLRTAFLP